MTGKKVKGAGVRGKALFYIYIKKIKMSIICNGDDHHASRHPRAPHPHPGRRMEGEGPSPTPSNSPPSPPQIKPSQVSMSHRTPSPISSCKYVQIMPITWGAPAPTVHAPTRTPNPSSTSAVSAGAACCAVEGRGTQGRGRGASRGSGGVQEGLLASSPPPSWRAAHPAWITNKN